MGPKRKIAAMAAALTMTFSAGAGVAWAQGALDASAGASGAESGPTGSARALGGGRTESSLVAITPCRIIDTRLRSLGKLQVGGAATFAVKGSGPRFAQQGGRANGCGIPAGATAVEATITAVDAGSGFLRAWPTGQGQPNATFMNYGPGVNLSNTGLLPVCGASADACTAGFDLDLRAFGSATHVVVDVAGYYVPPISASVRANGLVARGSRVIDAIREVEGAYIVAFERDVSACTYQVTVGTSSPGFTDGSATAQPSTTGESVVVGTYDAAGEPSDRPFHLTVTC